MGRRCLEFLGGGEGSVVAATAICGVTVLYTAYRLLFGGGI